MHRHLPAIICLVLASLFWAVGGISWKIFESVGFAFIFVFWVSRLFKFLSVLSISYFRVKEHQPIKNRKEFAVIFLNAIFSLATPFFFVLALAYTKVSNAYFLQFTMSAWVLVFAVFFLGEKADWRKVLSIVLVLCGIVLIARPEQLLSLNPGVAFGLLSAISYAGDIITARELKDYSYHTVSVYTNALQFLVTTAALPFFIPGASSGISISPNGFAGIVAFGIMIGLASDLYYQALHTLQASTAAIIAHLELFFASILAFLLFAEIPTGMELAGYAAILAASIIILLRKSELRNFEGLLHLADKQ